MTISSEIAQNGINSININEISESSSKRTLITGYVDMIYGYDRKSLVLALRLFRMDGENYYDQNKYVTVVCDHRMKKSTRKAMWLGGMGSVIRIESNTKHTHINNEDIIVYNIKSLRVTEPSDRYKYWKK